MPTAWLPTEDYNKAQADLWEGQARQRLADAWEQSVKVRLPDLIGETQRKLSQIGQPAQAAGAPPPVALAPPAAPVASPAPSMPQTPPPAASGGAGDLTDTVRQAAIAHGIDPEVALRVAQSEGGLSQPAAPGDSGSSFGPFQLHYGNVAQGGNAVAGLGDEFTKQTGLDARDPQNVGQAIDFALKNAAQSGWGAFHGAARAGIDAMQGIGGSLQQAVAGVAPPASPPSASGQRSQFGLGLSAEDAYAACGPAAALAFAASNGRYPTVDEAMTLAKKYGWTREQGMAGIQSEQKLLSDGLGIPTKLEPQVDWQHVASDANSGNPVIVSTPGHYFTVSGTRQSQDGQTEYYVGTSGTDLRGGSPWMTADQMQSRMGAVQGALYADNPRTPGQSIASTGDAQPINPQVTTNPLENAGNFFSGLGSAAKATVDRVQSPGSGNPFIDVPGTAASAFGTGVQSALSPFAGPSEQFPTGGPLGGPIVGIGRAVSGHEQLATENPEYGQLTDLVHQLQQTAGTRELSAAEQNQYEQARARLSQIAGGTDIFAAGARNPQAPAREQQAQLLQGAAAGMAGVALGPGAIGTIAQDVLAPGPQLPFDAARLRSGASAALRSRQPAQLNLTPPPASPWQAALTTPSNQPVAQMLNQKPPQAAADTIVNRLVRATTNRFEAADRYQEDALRSAGINPLNPPEHLDVTARIRELAGDPAAQVLVNRDLKPVLQPFANDRAAQQTLSTYLIHQNNIDVAAALNNPGRAFSGGLTAADSQRALQDMQQVLPPQQWQELQKVSQGVYDFTDNLRTRMVDSGLIDRTTALDWQQKYPHWVPTRILDYLDGKGGPQAGAGAKISLADNGVRGYTLDGTTKFREDPLASIVGLANQVETKARKNLAAQAFVNLDQLRPAGQQLLTPTNRPATAQEPIVQMLDNGVVKRFLAPPELAAAINGPEITNAPGFVRWWTNIIRSVTTTLSPSFALVRNPSLDVPEYLLRTTAAEGGSPSNLPRIVSALFNGYADAFQGLLQGELRGAGAQRYVLGGGGQSGMVQANTFAGRAADVQRMYSNGIQVHTAGDLGRLLKDIVTLKPIAAVAERTELGPRIAAMRMAEQRGATMQRAVLAGRQATIDFNEGGTLAKTINQFVPFFNAGVQGTALVPRTFRQNPVGTLSSVAMFVGGPTVTAQLWNRADPQRSQDYNDVPQYLKDQGVVVMLPGEAPRDTQGNRRPQFVWLNMRGWAPFSIAARDATDHILSAGGNGTINPPDALATLGAALGSASPIRANTIGDAPGALMPEFLPGSTTALQLSQNKDIFRNAPIVSNRADENAPVAAKEIADVLTRLVRLQNSAAEIHPSQVAFAVRDMLGGVGATAMGARELFPTGQQPRDITPQGAPVVGGALTALGVRGQTGQVLQTARQQGLAPEAQRLLNDLNLNQPNPVAGSFSAGSGSSAVSVPLLQNEEARYQQSFNRLASQLLLKYADVLQRQTDPLQRQKGYDQITQTAREQARAEVISTMNIPDVKQRVAANQAKLRTPATIP